jgi:hypothetical protein
MRQKQSVMVGSTIGAGWQDGFIQNGCCASCSDQVTEVAEASSVSGAGIAAAASAAGVGHAGHPRVRAAGHPHPRVWAARLPHVPAGAGRPPVEALASLLVDGGVRLPASA